MYNNTKKKGRGTVVLEKKDIKKIKELASILTKQQIADYFGITYKTYRAIEKRQPEAEQAYLSGNAKAIADIGIGLKEKALNGDLKAMMFFLKTRAKWTENHPADTEDKQPEEINIVIGG